MTGIKNISVWDTIFSIWLSSLLLGGEGLGQFRFLVSATMELPSLWSPRLWNFLSSWSPRLWLVFHHSLPSNRFAFAMVSIWLPFSCINTQFIEEIQAYCIRITGDSSFGKYQVLLSLPRIIFLYDSILFSIIGINPRNELVLEINAVLVDFHYETGKFF